MISTPADLPQNRWLEHYAERFDTVEINNTFYRLPEAKTFADPDEPIRRFFTRAKRLGDAFGPVLYQLPSNWPVNLDRLETFLKAMPPGRRHAIEFRDPSWYSDEVFARLEHHNVALCLHDMQGSAYVNTSALGD